ncbi:hypothetical protein LQ948_18180 [Jiella sp. MQZ9-1]|uniref:Nuclease-like protein n=1 Tax=Jiella flava TaxID=2816857 RepID=A0A939G2G1_9HYPH|nr:hypothetical protein [Jiella flava]MBO0664496.1 hypothetical protein [Jiella flava]MCD2473132.1 hypothetical protein [Jiella flava]
MYRLSGWRKGPLRRPSRSLQMSRGKWKLVIEIHEKRSASGRDRSILTIVSRDLSGLVSKMDFMRERTSSRWTALCPNLSRLRSQWIPRTLLRDAVFVFAVFLASLGIGHMRQQGVFDNAAARLVHSPIRTSGHLSRNFTTTTPFRNNILTTCDEGEHDTCLVNGDTGWEGNIEWQLIDTAAPSKSAPGCRHESLMAERAIHRLLGLMENGYTMSGTDYDRSGRRLVHIILPDGRDAGQILKHEKLARRRPPQGSPWC